jgi:hypothetical protein
MEAAPRPAAPPWRPFRAIGRGLVAVVRGLFAAVWWLVRSFGRSIAWTVRTALRAAGWTLRTLFRGVGGLFGGIRRHGGEAARHFAKRPEHSRWRAYAFGCYGLVLAGTFAAQLYTSNSLGAYVKVQPVVLPNATVIFVRNDSSYRWVHARVTLNDAYTFEKSEVEPGGHLFVPVDKFAVYDNGRATYAPKNLDPRKLRIDCDRGTYQTELNR